MDFPRCASAFHSAVTCNEPRELSDLIPRQPFAIAWSPWSNQREGSPVCRMRPGKRGTESSERGRYNVVSGRDPGSRRTDGLFSSRRCHGCIRRDLAFVWLQLVRSPAAAGGPGAARAGRSARLSPTNRAIPRGTARRSSSRFPTGSATADSASKAGPSSCRPRTARTRFTASRWRQPGTLWSTRPSPTRHSSWAATRSRNNRPMRVLSGPPTPCSRSATASPGCRLSMTVTVSNPTADDLPYGFGIHPYFRLPFPPGGDLARTQVIIPASKYWVLNDFLPDRRNPARRRPA